MKRPRPTEPVPPRRQGHWLRWAAVLAAALAAAAAAAVFSRSKPLDTVQWQELDGRCGIRFAHDFVSEAEIAALLGLVDATGGWAPSVKGEGEFLVPKGIFTGAFAPRARLDPVVRAIEDRIARHTGRW
jgi:hypothetical protein